MVPGIKEAIRRNRISPDNKVLAPSVSSGTIYAGVSTAIEGSSFTNPSVSGTEERSTSPCFKTVSEVCHCSGRDKIEDFRKKGVCGQQ